MEKYKYLKDYLEESAAIAKDQIGLFDEFIEIAKLCKSGILNGNAIFFCGNGGSAADSQHLAAELIGRFKKDRDPIKAIALTTDTSILTSISNDFSFEEVFTKQLEGLSSSGDILISISTSGESPSILNVSNYAKSNGLKTVAFTNNENNSLVNICDYKLQIPSNETGIVQQGHITFGQLLCYYLETELYPD
tara:strand:- start:4278 stop:4853 length:576 start_codon:yes stop_codon:yes gene_type:complete